MQTAPALVAGAAPQLQPNAAMTAQLPSAYTVQRPFFLGGQRVEIGATIDLPWPLAAELASAGKVAPVATPVVASQVDQPAEASTPAPAPAAPRRPARSASA